MAERPSGYGFTAEVAETISSKYDANRAKEVMEWIMSYVKDADLESVESAEDVQDKLKDGIFLCQLINAIEPKTILKINESKMAFKQMENISNFLLACQKFGCNKLDLFQTVSLYEGTNIPQVIDGIFALGRKVASQGKKGIGPKESEKNQRQFSEQQLRSGDGHIGLQAGYNKGASQAGQNFGKTRAIID